MITAGSEIRLYLSATPVSMGTPLPMELESGTTYKLTSANIDKNIWRSPDTEPTYQYLFDKSFAYQDLPYEKYKDLVPYLMVYDGGTTFAERLDPQYIKGVDFLSGKIILETTYTPTGTIYVQTDYIPFSTVSCVRTLEINEEVDLSDVTRQETVVSDNDNSLQVSRRKQAQLYTLNGSMTGFYDYIENFDEIFRETDFLYVRVYPDLANDPNSFLTVKCILEGNTKNFNVEQATELTVNWQSNEPYSEV